jgi:hypothetical protein
LAFTLPPMAVVPLERSSAARAVLALRVAADLLPALVLAFGDAAALLRPLLPPLLRLPPPPEEEKRPLLSRL